jgi:hypothetical protein
MPLLRCLEPGCSEVGLFTRCAYHTRIRNHERNARPERVALYGGDWPAESRRIREGHPFCTVMGCQRLDLTVDHPTRDVLCRRHHGQLEARRRAARGLA